MSVRSAVRRINPIGLGARYFFFSSFSEFRSGFHDLIQHVSQTKLRLNVIVNFVFRE